MVISIFAPSPRLQVADSVPSRPAKLPEEPSEAYMMAGLSGEVATGALWTKAVVANDEFAEDSLGIRRHLQSLEAVDYAIESVITGAKNTEITNTVLQSTFHDELEENQLRSMPTVAVRLINHESTEALEVNLSRSVENIEDHDAVIEDAASTEEFFENVELKEVLTAPSDEQKIGRTSMFGIAEISLSPVKKIAADTTDTKLSIVTSVPATVETALFSAENKRKQERIPGESSDEYTQFVLRRGESPALTTDNDVDMQKAFKLPHVPGKGILQLADGRTEEAEASLALKKVRQPASEEVPLELALVVDLTNAQDVSRVEAVEFYNIAVIRSEELNESNAQLHENLIDVKLRRKRIVTSSLQAIVPSYEVAELSLMEQVNAEAVPEAVATSISLDVHEAILDIFLAEMDSAEMTSAVIDVVEHSITTVQLYPENVELVSGYFENVTTEMTRQRAKEAAAAVAITLAQTLSAPNIFYHGEEGIFAVDNATMHTRQPIGNLQRRQLSFCLICIKLYRTILYTMLD